MENENKKISSEEVNNTQDTLHKIEGFGESVFKKIDEKSGVFYFFIAIICFLVFVISIIYFMTKVQFNKETNTYVTKNGRDVYELKLDIVTPYDNSFTSDTEEIELQKETELSSLVFTDMTSYEETENVKINANIPKLNISPELNITEINKMQNKISDIQSKIQTIRTVFEGNNQLNFSYYAHYYKHTLSFGYSYYENFNNTIINEKESFVYSVGKKKMMTFDEYLRSRSISEDKISSAVREIIRREKLKYKYNKKTKEFFIEPTGNITLIIDDKTKITIKIN